jgi:DNA repair protein RadC
MIEEIPKFSIRHLPAEERPREKLVQQGVDALSTVELIAIILGSGTKHNPIMQLSQQILAHFGSLEKLAEASIVELQQIKGLGLAKAIQLQAAIGLGLKLSRTVQPQKVRIEHPSQAYSIIRDIIAHEKREVFMTLMLDIKNGVLCHELVSVGTLTNTLVHPREVFYSAIRNKAATIIVAHNHPSGDPTPSKEDIKTTHMLVEAGKIMGIPVQDHLIVTKDTYISLKLKGYF